MSGMIGQLARMLLPDRVLAVLRRLIAVRQRIPGIETYRSVVRGKVGIEIGGAKFGV